MNKTSTHGLLVAAALLGLSGCNSCADRPTRLAEIDTWMYQSPSLDEDGAVEALADTAYPLLVLEPGHSFSEFPYATRELLEALRPPPDGGERLLVAYIDIGQAEDYRDDWEDVWVPPTATERGSPDFLVTLDPDGWSGNYPVAYWDDRWQALWVDDGGIIDELTNLGFDGIYLGWVEAYDDEQVIAAAEEEGVDAPEEMITFIERLRDRGQSSLSDFLVIPRTRPTCSTVTPTATRPPSTRSR